MQSCDVVLYLSSIACAITKCYSDEEVAFLAAAFSQLGDSLSTILAHKDMCDKKEKDKNKDNNNKENNKKPNSHI